MAVYTNVNDAELGAFLAQYDVGEAISFKGIAEGSENSNFLLRTEKASFILTLYETRVAEADLPFFLGLLVHMSNRGINCPVPVAGGDGALYRELNGRPAALITFLDGVSIALPDADHCRQLGVALAEFHVASKGFESTRPNGLGQKDWAPLFEKCRARAGELEPGLATFVDAQLEVLDAQWPAELPRGIIHGDLFPDNVFFLGHRFSGIIDPYFACEDLLAYDLATCLNAWCFDTADTMNAEKAAALLAGYTSIRPLSPTERSALPLLCRGAALRFFLTRLYDWLFHPDGATVIPKDPGEFLNRLTFHATPRTPKDYGLE